MVAVDNDENLVNTLLNQLIGEVDNNPKEPSYLLNLQMALKNFKQVTKIALIIANGEIENANYKVAQKFLYETITTIKEQGGKIPLELNQKFCLLHSQIIVRNIIKMNDHLCASRLLIRISKNISVFQQHAANILTTTVVECTKAKLKCESQKWALVVVKPEQKDSINETYKGKIENIARKPVTTEDMPEDASPCY